MLLVFLILLNCVLTYVFPMQEAYHQYFNEKVKEIQSKWPRDFRDIALDLVPIISSFAVDYTQEEFEKNSRELISAASRNNISRVKQLLQIGVDINKKEDKTGYTALIYAARNGNRDIVQLLIENKADLNIVDNEGNTALMCTIYYSCDEIAKLLIAKGTDLNILNAQNQAALTFARRYKRSEIINLILAIQEKSFSLS